MIKKLISPVLLLAAVFCVSMFAQRSTLTMQENVSLFLLTPDYLREVFSAPLPLSHLLGNFLAQFYRFSIYGPSITAVEILLVLLLSRGILKQAGLSCEPVAVLAACTAWWFTARSCNPVVPAAIILFMTAAWLVLIAVRRQKGAEPMKWWQALTPSVLIAVSCVVICSDGKVRNTETIAGIEQAALSRDWRKVLSLATPEFTSRDPEMLPYALLALSGTGELSKRVQEYKNCSPEAMEGDKAASYRGYLAGAILYDELGCHNEAVHRIYQASDDLPHGTGLLMLRLLIRHYCDLSDVALAEKYCSILSRSSLHGQYVRHYRQILEGLSQREPDSPEKRAQAAIMTHDHSTNLLQLEAEGISSNIATERFLCSLLLSGNIEAFQKAMGLAGVPTPSTRLIY